MVTKRQYSLLGGEVTITVRYGWAIVQNIDHETAAVTVPSVTRWRMTFDLVSWHESYEDAMVTVSAFNLMGYTPDDWKAERTKRDRRKKKAGATPEQGGGDPAAVPRQIAAGPASPLVERLTAIITRATQGRVTAHG